MYDFAKENDINVWIGIFEKEVESDNPDEIFEEPKYDFFWVDGTLVSNETSYLHWANKQPEYI